MLPILQRFAKESIYRLLSGHITKEVGWQTPKVLEHIVDVVLQFEGDQNYTYRILRTLKTALALPTNWAYTPIIRRIEVSNPSELLMSQHSETLSGKRGTASLEGMRPGWWSDRHWLRRSVYGTPGLSATGLTSVDWPCFWQYWKSGVAAHWSQRRFFST